MDQRIRKLIFFFTYPPRFISVKITKNRISNNTFAFSSPARIPLIEHRLAFQECNYELLGNVNLIKHPRFTPGRIFLAGVARCPGLLTSRPSRRLIKLNVRFQAGSPSLRVNEPRFRFSRQIGGKSFNGNKCFLPPFFFALAKKYEFYDAIMLRDKRIFRRDRRIRNKVVEIWNVFFFWRDGVDDLIWNDRGCWHIVFAFNQFILLFLCAIKGFVSVRKSWNWDIFFVSFTLELLLV